MELADTAVVAVAPDKTRMAGEEPTAIVMRTMEDFFGGVPWNTGDWYAKMERIEPIMFKGKRCNGTVDTFHSPITEEEIEEKHGQGLYKLILLGPRKGATGRKQYRVFTFNIPRGEPKLADQISQQQVQSMSVGDNVVSKAFEASQTMAETMWRETKDATEKLMEKIEAQSDDKKGNESRQMVDMMRIQADNSSRMMEMQMNLFKSSMEQIRAEVQAQTQQAQMLRNEPKKEDNDMDAMKLLEMQDRKHQQQLELMREEAKLRADTQEREAARRDELSKREGDRLIAMMQTSHQQQMEMMGTVSTAQLGALNKQIEMYRTELENTRARVQNPPSLVDELGKYRDLRAVVRDVAGIEEGGGLGGAATPEKEGWETGLEKVTNLLNNPIAAGVFAKLFGVGSNSVSQVTPGVSPPAIPASTTQQVQSQPQLSMEARAKMAKILNTIETAIQEGQDANQVAASIMADTDHSLLIGFTLEKPDAIIGAVEMAGRTESPILTVGGKQFVRQLHGVIASALSGSGK
jgi:hypothetical protein